MAEHKTEYEGNTNRSRREAEDPVKKLDKIVTGSVNTKKKTGVSKIANAFISEDVSNVKSYVLLEVLIPAIKKAVSDIITNGIEMILYGESSKSNRRNDRSDKVSYGKYYGGSNDSRERDRSSRTRATYEYDDVVVQTKGEAERVIDHLDAAIRQYGTASVSDLYDLVGFSGTYTDNKYGWTDVRTARSERVRDGYLIKMPRAVPLD